MPVLRDGGHVDDEVAYHRRILAFHSPSVARIRFTTSTDRKTDDPRQEGELHFRSARADVWRDVHTAAQIERAAVCMPE